LKFFTPVFKDLRVRKFAPPGSRSAESPLQSPASPATRFTRIHPFLHTHGLRDDGFFLEADVHMCGLHPVDVDSGVLIHLSGEFQGPQTVSDWRTQVGLQVPSYCGCRDDFLFAGRRVFEEKIADDDGVCG
jgi:hypothetical protein